MFALGGVFMPSVNCRSRRAMFATPFASTSRARHRVTPDARAPITIDVGRRRFALVSLRIGRSSRQPYALLVHGWSSFGLRFVPWVARLRAAGYAVITFDQPGHGKSPANSRRCLSSRMQCALSDCITECGAGRWSFARRSGARDGARRNVARRTSGARRAERGHDRRRRSIFPFRASRRSSARCVLRMASAPHRRRCAHAACRTEVRKLGRPG